MLRYFLQRFLMTLPALWLVLTLVFLMIHIVPGDPVEQMLVKERLQESSRNYGILWDSICRCPRNTGIIFRNLRTAIWETR